MYDRPTPVASQWKRTEVLHILHNRTVGYLEVGATATANQQRVTSKDHAFVVQHVRHAALLRKKTDQNRSHCASSIPYRCVSWSGDNSQEAAAKRYLVSMS